MTDQPRRTGVGRRTPRAAAILTAISLIAIAALAPAAMAQGTIVVSTIPGEGWIQSLENTAGGSAQLVAGPDVGRLGNGSLELTIAANTDLAGVEHPFLPSGVPFSDLTAASWRTFVTGAGVAEPAALKFTGYQDGVFPFNGFTTLVVELVYNGGTTPNAWQDNALGGGTTVWQTNEDDGFCTDTTFCEFDEFKETYPDARFFNVQVSIGTGVPAVTSYVDGVSLTIAGVADTWDFEVAAAPTPTPVASEPAPASPAAPPTAAPSTGGGELPDTSTDADVQPVPALGIAIASLALLGAVGASAVRRRRFRD